jgi:hypothetical protein
MKEMYVKVENGQLVEVPAGAGGFCLEWDGVFWIHYGEQKMHRYKAVVYDCFPIVTINDELQLESIELFGCVGDDRWEDGYLWEIPMDYDEWSELRPFKDVKRK